ncbi:flagellin N-terminal helical domain-containing protein [Alkalimarinus alittae]|uniref:Flagellin n=1 Tax=Alkalimarinus alittae TaxID=2961619 RepID=A0ABY6N6E3_9ALTE|nr:flagellin [Alkalimarinus alittae]UZE97564.1 flagellin [Alkalimarinus alittae]
MPQIINTNIASINAQRNLNNSQGDYNTSLQRLSSGLRINSAKDDAAGLAISTRFTTQTRGLDVAMRNAGDGVSLSQTAEGALGSMTENLLRIRDLALQSANATNSAVDRDALNIEVQQLKDEIQRISEQTNFNGTKLLDGTFEDVTFQIGANEGESLTFGIAGVTTSTLGSAETAGISSTMPQTPLTGPGAANGDAMVSGDLVINNIAVEASSGVADTASTTHAASSAIAKASAINAVSDSTGVTATANINTVKGTLIADAAIAVGATPIDINGQTFSLSKVASGNAAADLASAAATINEKSGATGVVATVIDMPSGARIDLTAEDGRNITIVGATAGSFGLATGLGTGGASNPGTTGNTYTGDITLASTDGSSINLTTNTGNIDNAGFEVGTYSGTQAGTISDNVDTGNALAAGDITINGVSVGASKSTDDTASTLANNAGSAIAKAAAINKISDQTGVTAEANATSVVGAAITGTTAGAFAITINDVAIGGTTTADAVANQTTIVDAINAKAGQTGVTASIIDGDKLNLVAEDGRTIELATATAGDTGLTAGNTGGSITLTSAGQFTIGTNTGDNEHAGLNVGSFGGTESGMLLKDVDISTVDGALAALEAVDNSLNKVNFIRADLGAIQNRFESTIDNQAITAENLESANSRIRDADFAAETAELSRAQVLQSAGLSVLSQANAQPQQVLQLLQG